MLGWLFFKNYLLSKRSGALVRMVSWLCIVGVALGVTALIVVLSVMNGFNRTIRQRMFNVEPHIVVPLQAKQTWDNVDLAAELERRAGSKVESVSRYESRDVIVRSIEGSFAGGLAKGYEDGAIQQFLSRVNSPTVDLARNEVILGSDFARGVGVYEGDEIIVIPPESLLLPKGEVPRFDRFKVKAIVATQIPEVDAKLILYSLNHSRPSEHFRASLERGFEVRLYDPDQYQKVSKEISELKLTPQDWTMRNNALFFALKMEKGAMALFLSLAVLITSFSVVTVMVLVLNQKRRDIGMMMAMGLSQRLTHILFLKVGLILAGIGMFSGVFLGSAISLILHFYPLEVLPDIYQDTSIPADLSLMNVLLVIVGSTILAVLGAALPILRMKNLSPSANLRGLKS